MTLSLFDQFLSPVVCWIPLVAIAIMLPWILFPSPTTRWVNNRNLTSQNWFLGQSTSQIFSPINPSGHKWAILLSSLLIFLTTMNTAGLLPYTFTPTSQLSINMGFAGALWMGIVILGMRTQPTHSLGHLLPEGAPALLTPVLVIIETISLFIRPIALGVRLTANLTAGHLLIQLTSTATLALLTIMPITAIFTGVLLFLLALLEAAVALIQAYVFILLLSLYLQENV
ncbi:ATP synthase F0 subunit 6 (mitochondrion) [Poecilia reticulata]|uniref:ATP synthase subunit a n=1 Tax=Poecilia reticulata TaxID=8081 RepID=A0A023UMH6_POERE|nr:ATP synthase F0 subunit 6 [Poecilia reticulata]AHY04281.1 ATP synthase F0 subunit 6 [Poecilia reticulata]